MPRALIPGITGQDGSCLAEFLLAKRYEVFGTIRRLSTENFARIEPFKDRIQLCQGDLLDQLSLMDLLRTVRPSEGYNLAAMSFVPVSWRVWVLAAECSTEPARALAGEGLDGHQGFRSSNAPAEEGGRATKRRPTTEGFAGRTAPIDSPS